MSPLSKAKMSPRMVNDLALALQRIEKASQISTERERCLRAEVAEQAEVAAKDVGISAETAALIRQALDQIDD